MATDYIVPQVRIFQQFAQLPNSVVRNQNAFVFGPSYTLYRYANETTKPLAFLYDYVGSANISTAWPQGYSADIDLSYAKMYADSAYIQYSDQVASSATGTVEFIGTVTTGKIVTIGAQDYEFVDTLSAGPTVPFQVLKGSNYIQTAANFKAAINLEGDIGTLYSTGTTVNTDVTCEALSPTLLKLTAIVAGTDGNAIVLTTDYATAITVSGSGTLAGGEASGSKAIVTSAGDAPTMSFTSSEDLASTSDVSGIANAGGARVGDVVAWGAAGSKTFATITAIAYSGGKYCRVTIDQDPPGNGITVYLARVLSGVLIPEGTTSYEVDQINNVIDIKEEMQFPYPGGDATTTARVLQASLYMEYRVRNYANSTDIGSISDTADVYTDLGADIHPDDPLTYAVYQALINAGGRTVYYIATNGEASEWSDVLKIARPTKSLYAFTPVSAYSSVRDLVKASVTATSDASVKRWRICFFGMEVTDETAIYDDATLTADYTASTLTFSDIKDTAGTTINCHSLGIGDKIYFNFNGDVAADSATITGIMSNTSVTVSNLTSAVLDASAGRVALFRVNDADDDADIVAATSLAAHSYRMYHVFGGKTANGTNPTGEIFEVGNEFVAAGLAGLCCSVPPQQPLTNLEVTGLSSLPNMYRRYSQEQLDTMAAAGTLIVAQDYVNGPIYVRHQLSTARIDNNLNTTELSLIKNLDSISYYFADAFVDLIGKTNITPETMAIVNLRLKDGIDYLSSNTAVGDIGPQLLTANTKINSVAVDGVLKDTINADVDLDLPKPFNVFNLILRAV